jgi:hypothetical protein
VHAVGAGRAQDRRHRRRHHLLGALQPFEVVGHLHERAVPGADRRAGRHRSAAGSSASTARPPVLGAVAQLDQRRPDVQHVAVEERLEARADAAGGAADRERQPGLGAHPQPAALVARHFEHAADTPAGRSRPRSPERGTADPERLRLEFESRANRRDR